MTLPIKKDQLIQNGTERNGYRQQNIFNADVNMILVAACFDGLGF